MVEIFVIILILMLININVLVLFHIIIVKMADLETAFYKILFLIKLLLIHLRIIILRCLQYIH